MRRSCNRVPRSIRNTRTRLSHDIFSDWANHPSLNRCILNKPPDFSGTPCNSIVPLFDSHSPPKSAKRVRGIRVFPPQKDSYPPPLKPSLNSNWRESPSANTYSTSTGLFSTRPCRRTTQEPEMKVGATPAPVIEFY